LYDAGEPVIAGTAPAVGTLLKSDLRIKYVETDGNKVWDPGESVVYDVNLNNIYDGGPPATQLAEPVIAGAAPRVTPSGAYTLSTIATPAGLTPPVIGTMKLCVVFPGDINVDANGRPVPDGAVNFLDLQIIGQRWLRVAGDPLYNSFVDINKDGVINFLDLQILGANWARSC
jgi:hypothetical protein